MGAEFGKDRALLEEVWSAVSREIESGELDIREAEGILEFNKAIVLGEYPAVHHSREYSQAYKPAYRLIGKQF